MGQTARRHDADGRPVEPGIFYTYLIERGPQRVASREAAAGPVLIGQSLLDLDADDLSDPRSLLESKLMMRTLITYYLAGKELETRKILKELQDP